MAALAQVEDARPHDEFLLSYGWYHPLWHTPELPTKEIIDRVYPDRPVCLMSADVHTLWLNSKALEVLGITDDAVPPAGGIYQRDVSGHLTGIVQEAAAFALLPRIYRVAPRGRGGSRCRADRRSACVRHHGRGRYGAYAAAWFRHAVRPRV